MPFVTINVLEGKGHDYIKKVSDSVNEAVIETMDFPDDDRYQVVNQLSEDCMQYQGRQEERIMMHLVMRSGRPNKAKQAFYKKVVENLHERVGVKPENILVGPYGEVLLLDWGLAKVWHPDGTDAEAHNADEKEGGTGKTMTGRGKLQGSICYMSPEQIHRDTGIDGRADVFSVGSVLYEILCGENPAVGESMAELKRSALEDTPVAPSLISQFPIPERLAALAMQCLSKDPNLRPQTAAELVRELNEDWR